LYSRLGDAGFLRADGMIALLENLVRQFAVPGKSTAHTAIGRAFRIFGTMRFYEQQRTAMSIYDQGRILAVGGTDSHRDSWSLLAIALDPKSCP